MAGRKPTSASGARHAGAWGLLLVTLVCTVACGDKDTYVPPPPPKVTVTQPVKQKVSDYMEFTGNTQAINTVKLRARVQGYLEKVFFQDGDQVKKGQQLFLIQQNTYEAKLQQAQAEVLAQKANLEHADTEFARFSKLFQQKAAAQTDVDKWRYERDAARATVLAAEAKRELAKLDLGYTKVTAPFDGRIDRRLKDPGNVVGAGEETVLAEINQIDPIYVYFNINEMDLLRVMDETRKKPPPTEKNKQKWPVFLGLANEQGYPHQGQLDFAAITLSPTTGTLLLRGIFPNPDGKILPGLFARVRTPVALELAAMLIPQVAVGYDQLGSYVLVVSGQNVVERRSVRVGALVKDMRIVEDGLQGEEWVIVDGLLRAIPGRQVSPVRKESPAPTPSEEPAPATPDSKKAGS